MPAGMGSKRSDRTPLGRDYPNKAICFVTMQLANSSGHGVHESVTAKTNEPEVASDQEAAGAMCPIGPTLELQGVWGTEPPPTLNNNMIPRLSPMFMQPATCTKRLFQPTQILWHPPAGLESCVLLHSAPQGYAALRNVTQRYAALRPLPIFGPPLLLPTLPHCTIQERAPLASSGVARAGSAKAMRQAAAVSEPLSASPKRGWRPVICDAGFEGGSWDPFFGWKFMT